MPHFTAHSLWASSMAWSHPPSLKIQARHQSIKAVLCPATQVEWTLSDSLIVCNFTPRSSCARMTISLWWSLRGISVCRSGKRASSGLNALNVNVLQLFVDLQVTLCLGGPNEFHDESRILKLYVKAESLQPLWKAWQVLYSCEVKMIHQTLHPRGQLMRWVATLSKWQQETSAIRIDTQHPSTPPFLCEILFSTSQGKGTTKRVGRVNGPGSFGNDSTSLLLDRLCTLV